MSRNAVIKHSAAIQMTNRVNLLQRRTWNVLLAEAFDHLLDQEEHSYEIAELTKILKFDSKNETYLRDMLKELATTGVEWNVLEKDGTQKWGITTLLAQAEIINGILTYAYSPVLRKNLHNPNMYARISLSMQNKFNSKHTLALYELCVDYFDFHRKSGTTPWIPLKKYRKLMGLEDDEYRDFRRLNTRLIKDPIAEINEKSDLFIEADYHRDKRRISHIKFLITPNPNKENLMDIPRDGLPALNSGFEGHALYKRLTNSFAFSHSQALDILEEHPEDYVADILDEVERRIREGKKIESVPAYTLKALREDWRPRQTAFEAEREKTRDARREAEAEKTAAAKKAHQEKQHRLARYDENFSRYEKALQKQVVKTALERLKKEDPWSYDLYQKGRKSGKRMEDMLAVKGLFIEHRNAVMDELPAEPAMESEA